jgi:hypothetical protein
MQHAIAIGAPPLRQIQKQHPPASYRPSEKKKNASKDTQTRKWLQDHLVVIVLPQHLPRKALWPAATLPWMQGQKL